MDWNTWLAANPFPYDLTAMWNEGLQLYPGMDFGSMPQEWRDQYEAARRANAQHEASFYQQTGTAPSQEASLFNPFITNNGGAWFTNGGNTEFIGEQPQTDWYSEAVQGNPVIGGSVSAGMPVSEYNAFNPNNPTAVQSGSQVEQDWLNGLTQQLLDNQSMTAFQVGQGLTDLGQSLGTALTPTPTNYSGGGTITDFWSDNAGNTNNPYSVKPQGQNMGDLFSQWFKNTYGSSYGMNG